MNIEKIDEDLYYYTDILTQEEQDIVINTIKNEDGWARIYNRGDAYNPDKDPDADSNQSCMVAYRKYFKGEENAEFINIIDKAFQKTTKHYREDKGIKGEAIFPPFKYFAHVDKHMQGTTYETHIDTAPSGLESYTVLFYLNDDYVGGELSFSAQGNKAKGTYPPDHEKNDETVYAWIKSKTCSIVIFPPLKPYPHTAHEVKEGVKYLIKGYWSPTNKVLNG